MKPPPNTLAFNKSLLSKEVIHCLYQSLNVANFLNKMIFLNKIQRPSTEGIIFISSTTHQSVRYISFQKLLMKKVNK